MHSKGNRFSVVLSTHGYTLHTRTYTQHTHTHARVQSSRTLAVTECLHDAEMREERKGWKKIRATRSLVNVPCRTVPYLATSYPFASFYRLGYSSSSILFLFSLFREIFRILVYASYVDQNFEIEFSCNVYYLL